jgi:hypothetical protein
VAIFFANSHLHPPVRVSRKPVLKAACDRITDSRQYIPRTGDCLKPVRGLAGCEVQSEKEQLLTLFDVQLGGGVNKAELMRGVDGFNDSTQVQRPEAEGPYFNGDDFASRYRSARIRYASPAEIELRPTREGALRRIENGLAAA